MKIRETSYQRLKRKLADAEKQNAEMFTALSNIYLGQYTLEDYEADNTTPSGSAGLGFFVSDFAKRAAKGRPLWRGDDSRVTDCEDVCLEECIGACGATE